MMPPLLASTTWVAMVPLGLCGVLLLALALERFLTFSRLRPRALLDEFNNLKRGSRPQPETVREAVLVHPGLLAILLTQALHMAGRPAAEVKERLQETTDAELLRLRTWNHWFAFAARIGPLLALLGMVLGLINAYSAAGARGQQMAAEVAANLDATRWGVIIAICGETLAALFRHRLDRFRLDLDNLLAGVPEKVSLLGQGPPPAAPTASPLAEPPLPASVNGHQKQRAELCD